MTSPVGKQQNGYSDRMDAFPLIEFPKGDFNDYYYTRQIWMVVVHVRPF